MTDKYYRPGLMGHASSIIEILEKHGGRAPVVTVEGRSSYSYETWKEEVIPHPSGSRYREGINAYLLGHAIESGLLIREGNEVTLNDLSEAQRLALIWRQNIRNENARRRMSMDWEHYQHTD